MKLPERLKNVGTRIATAFLLENEEAVKEFIRSYMMARTEPYNEGHLAYAIQNKTDLWAEASVKLRSYAQRVARDPRVLEVYRKYSARVNADLVLEWLKVDRPGWYGVINNWGGPEAMDWLRSQTEKVKTELLKGVTALQAPAPPAARDVGPSPPQRQPEIPYAKEVSPQVSRRS